MPKQLTPDKVQEIVMANGGWKGRLAIRAKLYRQKVRAWQRNNVIPDVWMRVLRRFKAFREFV